MDYTKVVSNDQFSSELKSVIDTASRLVDAGSSGVIQSIVNNKPTAVTNPFKAIQLTRNSSVGLPEMLKAVLAEATYRSEMGGPGSGGLLLKLIEKFVSDAAIGLWNPSQINVSEIAKALVDKSEFVSDEIMLATLTDITQSKIVSGITFDAIKLAGLEGKIFVEDYAGQELLLELTEGYTFTLDPLISSISINRPWKAENAKCLVIDGTIEGVHEIHNLLDTFVEKKEALLIVARGYSPDVLNTLKVNFDRGTLNVAPYQIPYDLEYVNVLNDIAAVVGADVISSLKGQTISSIKYEDLGNCKSINCSNKTVIITNHHTKNAVAMQVANLLAKRSEASDSTLMEIVDKRIRSLSAHSVKIHIPKFAAERNLHSEKIDLGLRAAKSMLTLGLVRVDNLRSTNNETLQVVCKFLDALGKKIVPIATILSALELSIKTTNLLLSVSRAVIIEDPR